MGVPINPFSIPPLSTAHYLHVSELFSHDKSPQIGNIYKCKYVPSHLKKPLFASLFQSAIYTISLLLQPLA